LAACGRAIHKKVLPPAAVSGNLSAAQLRRPDPYYRWVANGIEVTLMADPTDPPSQPSPWLGVIKFLLIAILIGMIFLLGQQMVRHRFFRGGWVDQRDVLKP
jgi:hypothetical protein